MGLTLKVNGVETPAEKRPLWWQSAGLLYSKTGYGKKIPTQYMVRYKNRSRRVAAACTLTQVLFTSPGSQTLSALCGSQNEYTFLHHLSVLRP